MLTPAHVTIFDRRRSWRRRGLLALALLLLTGMLSACRSPLVPPAPPAPPPAPFKWSVADILPQGETGLIDSTVPGFYCASCGSDLCRQRCVATGAAVGMQNRFLLCELMPAPGVYDLGPVRRWVDANAAAGLRSIIGFTPKTDRGYNAPNRGSCTAASDGSPAWMLQPGSVYQPLVNGTGTETTYHLNYRSPAVQSEWRGLMQALHQEFAAMPSGLLATVDSIELNIGHDGEMDPTRNYNNFPAGAPLGWMDLNMYRCAYAGYTWRPARNQQFCTDSNGAVVNTAQAYGASNVWRDEVLKPMIDIYGQELSPAVQGESLGKPLALLAVGQIITPDERATPCEDCDERNIVDYAFETYGAGIKSTGVNPDMGNGNSPDPFNLEYRNWPNIFKLTWPSRLTVGEHGVNAIGGGHCCDDPKEFYWAVLNALDKHMSQLHFLAADIGQPGAGAAETRQLWNRYAGKSVEDTPDIWIVLRDTAGTYYPDGDNGAAQANPPGRVPCCRWLPNFEWFVYQLNPAPSQVVRAGLPVSHKSLSARSNASGPLQFDVEDEWPGAGQIPQAAGGCAAYDVEIEFLDSGSDAFLLRYARMDGTEASASVGKTGTGQWRAVTLRLTDAYLNDSLPSGADLELASADSGSDIFHRLRVELHSDCAATATPTATRSPTATATATATPRSTPSPTLTPTSTPTASPTVTPTPTEPAACLPVLAGTLELPDNDQPKGMAADDNFVYVALYNQPRLAVIDAASDTLQSLQSLASGGVNGVAVVGDRVYTSNRNSAQLSISQAGSGALVGTVGVGGLPWGVDGAGDRVYVANFADGTLKTLSTISGSVIRTTAIAAAPAFVAARPDRVYVTHINGRLSMLSRNGSLLADFTPGSASQLWGLALNPEGTLLYLADRPNNRILVLSTATNQVVNALTLPGPPTALALNPGTGHLFAVDAVSDRVYVIDTRNRNLYLGAVAVGSQGAGDGGQGIAVTRNKVYVANWQGRNVSVLTDTSCPDKIVPVLPTPTPTPFPR